MKTLLVTGGSGYIGSHTVLDLARTGEYKIVVFDNLKNGHQEALQVIKKITGVEVELIKGDLLNSAEIEAALAKYKFDAVIHFAALIEAGVSMTEPTRFFENNISGTINLIKAMQKNSVNRIVFSSTAAVYGTPTVASVTEDYPTNPESWYGYSKLVVENLLASLSADGVIDAERINSVILRYFNAAGADPDLNLGQDYPKPTHLITVAIEAALGKRDKLTLFGNDYDTPDGTCIRDYIHVSDLANAHVKALEYLFNNDGKEIINIGTNQGTSNLEVVKKIEELNGAFPYEFGPRRAGDPTAYYANNTKAKELLGWTPKFTVSEAIEHAYNWAKKYPNGYADKVKEL
jgi:UDP-glucose-4-epimerase GalE